MDPFLRSSLFNQMMQALKLGDKRTSDRIESLIRNFHPDSLIPISVYVPTTEENSIHDISSPSSFDSDSPVMTRSSKSGGSRRRASRVPRGSFWMLRQSSTQMLMIAGEIDYTSRLTIRVPLTVKSMWLARRNFANIKVVLTSRMQ